MPGMRQPTRGPSRKQQIVKPIDWVAPTDGWRTDIPFTDMPPKSAATLLNFFPEPGYIRARNGSNVFASGMPSSVQTIIPYSGLAQNLFAASGSGIYDVTAGGTVGGAVVSSLNSSHWSHAQLQTAAGWFQTIVNDSGLDDPRQFNGTSWSSPALTGPGDIKKLHVICSYRERYYFLEMGTTTLWFTGPGAITGALGSFAVGPDMKFGGTLVAMNSWTQHVSTGVTMFLVIMSSEGELIIFNGSDPTNASNWGLLGTFKLGWPLGGDRCMYQIGGDLAIMTMDGIIPASSAISLDPSASDQASLTQKISPTFIATVQLVGQTTAGWQFLTYPNGRQAIVNVPDPVYGAYQFVMNTETNAWTKFTGMQAQCWQAWNNGLYYGDGLGNVIQADTGSADQGAPIACYMVAGWQRMGDGLAPKQSSTLGIDLQFDANASLAGACSFDYTDTPVEPTTITVGTANALWDQAIWDQAFWPGASASRVLVTVPGIGVVFAPTVSAQITGLSSTSSNCFIYGGCLHVQPGQGI
jgi:hypothetical protein